MSYKIFHQDNLAAELQIEPVELFNKIRRREIKALVVGSYIFIKEEVYAVHKASKEADKF